MRWQIGVCCAMAFVTVTVSATRQAFAATHVTKTTVTVTNRARILEEVNYLLAHAKDLTAKQTKPGKRQVTVSSVNAKNWIDSVIRQYKDTLVRVNIYEDAKQTAFQDMILAFDDAGKTKMAFYGAAYGGVNFWALPPGNVGQIIGNSDPSFYVQVFNGAS